MGDFEPSLLKTTNFEIAVKHYKRGDDEQSHVHKIAREFTLVMSGSIVMNDQIFIAGNIVEIEPGEFSKFNALEDSVVVVIKTPSIKGDKYVK